jgi:Mg-chelatase subunit ChlI
MKNFRFLTKTLLLLVMVVLASAVYAGDLKGTVSVKRNNSRQIIGACLHVGNQEYEIVMDENGKSLAEMYEHKDLQVSGSVDGNKITVETWSEIRSASAPEPAYKEPEPQDEPEKVEEEEPEEEPKEEVDEDEEPKDEEVKDNEPKDEEPKDDEEEKEESEEEPKEESED